MEKHADVLRFVALLNARRLLRGVEHERRRLSLNQIIAAANKEWHGVKLHQPDWSDASHSIAFNAEMKQENQRFHLILNDYWEPLEFELPPLAGESKWRRWIDTALDSPEDIVSWQEAPPVQSSTYRAEARSVVMLFSSDFAPC